MSTFDEIYTNNLWHGTESLSGPGSSAVPTVRVWRALVAIMSLTRSTGILDLGCGDGYWMPEFPGYIGVDVAEAAIARSRELHPGREYRVLPALAPLPDRDLVFMRDVLQHLPRDVAVGQLERIRATAARWLFASSYVDGDSAGVTDPLSACRIDMTVWLGEPELYVPDGWDHHDSRVVRDPAKMLGLWRLA